MKSRKGQLAFEFLLIYSFFIMVFMAALYVIGNSSSEQQAFAEGVFVREIAMRFADEVNVASSIQGYEKNYTFPRTLRGAPYTVSISNGLLEINYTTSREFSHIYPLETSNVSVNGVDTAQIIRSLDTTKGWAVIRNVNGEVVISQ